MKESYKLYFRKYLKTLIWLLAYKRSYTSWSGPDPLEVEASGRELYLEVGLPLTFAYFRSKVHMKAYIPFI